MLKRSNGRAWKSVLVLAALLTLLAPAALRADVIFFQVDAVSGGEGSSYAWAIPKDLDANGRQSWNMSTPLTLPGGTGATVDQLSLAIAGDPGVSLSFSVTAGLTDTLFTITSAVVAFTAIDNPLAYASAGITLTDTDGNGAALTGQFPATQAYEAHYNAAHTVYAQIVDAIVAPAETTVVTSERSPVAGRTVIVASVDQIRSQFKFLLSANDQASGTSRFDVIEQPIPEPGTLFLVGSGVLGLAGYIRRRRTK